MKVNHICYNEREKFVNKNNYEDDGRKKVNYFDDICGKVSRYKNKEIKICGDTRLQFSQLI